MGFHVFGGADAPTLMLLHGASTTWEKSFGEAIPVLSRRYRVIAYGAKEESFRNTAWSNLAWSADIHTLEPRPDMHVHCWWGQRERRSVRRSVTLLARVFPGLQTKDFIGLSHGELHTRHPARLKDALEQVV